MRRFAVLAVALTVFPLFAQVPQATTLYDQGKYDEAKKLVASLQNDFDAQLLLGKIALAQDDAEAAEKFFTHALELKPNNATAHLWLGNALGTQAQSANLFRQASLAGKTKDEFEKAVQLDPNLLDARFGLIDYYTMAPAIMGGSAEKAQQQAAEIKKRDVYQGHRAFARIYTRDKNLDLARKEWLDAVKEQPQSAKPHLALATFYTFNDKNYAAAWSEIEVAQKVEPALMQIQFRIGQVAAMSGQNFARGEEALKKYLTTKPTGTDPDLASTHYYLGMIYEKQGKKAEARQSYAAALKLNPRSKQISEAMKRVS
jgi:Tfp pilus assembly protein PilF